MLQEVNCKKQGRKKRLKRKLQKARKNANAKEKNLSEIYSKQGKRQGGKKNLRKIYKEQRRKKKPKQWPVNFLRQIETFEWIYVCFGPRISRLYDSHLDESWPDTIYYQLVPT